MQLTWPVVEVFSFLTVIGDALFVALFILLSWEWFTKKQTSFGRLFSRHALLLMFAVALLATCGSLFFSEVAGWVPCKECWFQRIFLYPQTALLLIALLRKDRNVAVSILILSLIGITFSIDQYADQMEALLQPTVDALKPCDASGVSCAATQFLKLGYITIPMMAMTAFALNIMGSMLVIRGRK